MAILEQAEQLLGVLPSELYARKVPVVFNASIGGHLRHCLDHFSSLLNGVEREPPQVDYDHRQRDARVENDPAYALAVACRIRGAIEEMTPATLEVRVSTRCEVSYAEGQSPLTASSIGREFVYAIAHAIHHYALIAVMARLLGAPLPEQFGIAPSTVAHLARNPDRH